MNEISAVHANRSRPARGGKTGKNLKLKKAEDDAETEALHDQEIAMQPKVINTIKEAEVAGKVQHLIYVIPTRRLDWLSPVPRNIDDRRKGSSRGMKFFTSIHDNCGQFPCLRF